MSFKMIYRLTPLQLRDFSLFLMGGGTAPLVMVFQIYCVMQNKQRKHIPPAANEPLAIIINQMIGNVSW